MLMTIYLLVAALVFFVSVPSQIRFWKFGDVLHFTGFLLALMYAFFIGLTWPVIVPLYAIYLLVVKIYLTQARE